MRKNKIYLWLLAAFLILCGWGYNLLHTDQGSEANAAVEKTKVLKVGDTLPLDIVLHGVDEKTSHTSDYKNKVILLNFWAGWCGPCLAEMPSIYKLYDKYHAKGLEMIAVDMDDDWKDGVPVLNSKIGKPAFPIFKGADEAIANAFMFSGVPFSVVVDKSGKILFAEPGEEDWMSAKWQRRIESLL